MLAVAKWQRNEGQSLKLRSLRGILTFALSCQLLLTGGGFGFYCSAQGQLDDNERASGQSRQASSGEASPAYSRTNAQAGAGGFAQDSGQNQALGQSQASGQNQASGQSQAAGQNQNSGQNQASGLTLKGEVSYCVPRGTGIKLKLASVPTNGMRLLDRDLDGNLLPAHVGDVITARTTEDIYVEDSKVIPAGTVFKGKVSNVNPPRRLQRPGWLEVSFNQLELPSGAKFAFRAEANNYKPSTMKSKARALGKFTAHAAGGAIVGALVAYKVFGAQNTAAMHGYNIAGGAAAGALIAAGYAMAKKGTHASLEPGDDLNLSIDTDLLMPALTEPTKKVASNNLEGLSIEVEKRKVVKDGLGGSFLRLDVNIQNHSEKRLNAIDLFARDANGNKYPTSMGPEEDSGFDFIMEPYSGLRTRLYFNTEYPKLPHELIWLDHKTRKICFRQKVE